MPRKCDTAISTEIALDNGLKLVIQEYTYFPFMRALRVIKALMEKAKAVGSIDQIMASFRQAEDGAASTTIDKLMDALRMLLTVVGDDPTLLLELIHYGAVEADDKKPLWTVERLGELAPHEIIKLLKAVWEVNWVKGSAKKSLAEVGLKFEPETSSNALSEKANTPSAKPTAANN